jgi:hypothetical protein
MSKVRIVRLSEVIGAVQMDRSVGRGFEPAIDNLPVVESSRIRTQAGVAEVEFEDNSTLRVGTDSEVDFPELERTASGIPVTEVRVVRGMAYISLVKTRNDDFTLAFGPGAHPDQLRLSPESHVRLQVSAAGAELAVLGGTVQVSGPDGLVTVPRKRTVSFSFAEMEPPAVTKKVAEESLDTWDRQSSQYHERVATLSAFGNSPYSYGLNDMMYYGEFSDAGGCGMMWQPYFAGAAWNPYATGVWAWYGGNAGYSWVSPYPWGWTPYHSGSWSYCPGNGWGWAPGGSWNGLANVPAVTRGIAARKILTLPRPPAGPPGVGRPTLTLVTSRPLVASETDGKGSFVFRRGSAGLGIPREGLGNLRGFSRDTLRHGTTSTPVYLSLDRGGMNTRGGAGNNQLAPVMVHRGFAPPPMSAESGFSSRGAFNSAPVNMGSGAPSAPVSSMSSAPAMGGAPRGGGGAPAGGGGGRPH